VIDFDRYFTTNPNSEKVFLKTLSLLYNSSTILDTDCPIAPIVRRYTNQQHTNMRNLLSADGDLFGFACTDVRSLGPFARD